MDFDKWGEAISVWLSNAMQTETAAYLFLGVVVVGFMYLLFND